MDSKINVSVAIATYNGERYLREQLDSIYNQTIKPIEVIVCDDGSKDNTIEILEEYKLKFNLVYYKNESNLGFYRNFEKAISKCTGDYIALADQDDIWMPKKIERLLKEIGNYSLICSDAQLINEKNEVIHDSYFKHQNLHPYYNNPFLNLIVNNYVTGCTLIFKKDLLKVAIPMPNIRYHDQWLGIVASQNGGLKFLNEKLICYRQHGSNDTGSHEFIALIAKLKQVKTLIRNRANFRNKNVIVINEILEVLNSKLNISESEKEILKNLTVYYKNRMRFIINPICLYYSLKYNNLLFGYHHKLHARLFAAFGTLIF